VAAAWISIDDATSFWAAGANEEKCMTSFALPLPSNPMLVKRLHLAAVKAIGGETYFDRAFASRSSRAGVGPHHIGQ